MMKKNNIFKKEILLFFLLLFSIFSTFSSFSLSSKRSASFFLVQEKVIEEEIDSEIWPLSNNLIILLFFLIIIFIIYTLYTIFPIPKEDKFLFANLPPCDVPAEKRLSIIISENLLQNLNNEENNISDVGSNDDSFESNKQNYFFSEKEREDLLLEIEKEKAEKSKDNPSGINLNNADKLDTKKIVDYKKKAGDYFGFLEENKLLMDGIIKSYESSTEEDDYGGANLVFKDEVKGEEINIKELGGYNNEQGENILYGDILGIGEMKNKNTNRVKNKTEVLINKYKFFSWMMYFVREKIILKKFSKIKNDKTKITKKGFVDSEIFKNGLEKIAEKLTYVSPGDNNKERKEKRSKALEKFINFFLVILYHFFYLNYKNVFKEEPSFLNPQKEEKIKLSFFSVGQKRSGFFNCHKNIDFKFTLNDVYNKHSILSTGLPEVKYEN